MVGSALVPIFSIAAKAWAFWSASLLSKTAIQWVMVWPSQVGCDGDLSTTPAIAATTAARVQIVMRFRRESMAKVL